MDGRRLSCLWGEDSFNSILLISHPDTLPLSFQIPSSVVLKIEKLQRDFLCLGLGKRKSSFGLLGCGE